MTDTDTRAVLEANLQAVTDGLISTIRAYVPLALLRAQPAPAAAATSGAVRQPASA